MMRTTHGRWGMAAVAVAILVSGTAVARAGTPFGLVTKVAPMFLGQTGPCDHTIVLYDDHYAGGGWQGNTVDVLVNGVIVLENLTITTGSGPDTYTFQASSGDVITTDYAPDGIWQFNNRYYIYDVTDFELCAAEDVNGYGPDNCDCIGYCDAARTYGSCCHADGSCTDEADEAACIAAGGEFGAIGSECGGVTCPGPGDTCDNPLAIDISSALLPYNDLAQRTCDRGNNYAGSYNDGCLSSNTTAEDMVYELNVTEAVCLEISLLTNTASSAGQESNANVAVFEACPLDAASCVYAAGGDYEGNNPDLIHAVSLDVGTYYIVVDGNIYNGCVSDFDLSLSECPAGGSCCTDGTCADVTDAAACPDGDYTQGGSCSWMVCRPGNDDCDTATRLFDADLPYEDLNIAYPAATNDASVNPSCDSDYNCTDAMNGIWYEYRPGQECTLVVGTSNAAYVGRVAASLWSGDPCVAPVEEGCVDVNNNGQTAMPAPLTAGVTYSILVSADNCNSAPTANLGVTLECTICGNGVLESFEECDDGNATDGDGCENDCTITPECGNGILEPQIGETCDDGNLDSGDGCDGTCQIELPDNDMCADAIDVGTLPATIDLDNTNASTSAFPGECGYMQGATPEADMWYTVTGTGNPITVSNCHDVSMYLIVGVYADCDMTCIDGNMDVCGWGYAGTVTFCTSLGETYYVAVGGVWGSKGPMTLTVTEEAPSECCGNGVVDTDEACDDGNFVEGDGCETDCTLSPVCGDGVIEGSEECDDGNTVNGDGCEDNCKFPPHDECVDAVTIGPLPVSITYDNSGDTNSAHSSECGDPNGWGYTPGHDVWYAVEGTGGVLTATTCPSGVDYSMISVYADCDLTCLGGGLEECGFGYSGTVSWCAQRGVTYYISVGDIENAPGEITLQVYEDNTTGIECILVPTVSEWGLVLMTLIALIGGTVVFARLRPVQA